MKIKILLFGVVNDLIKTEDNSITTELENNLTLAELKSLLIAEYKLTEINHFMIAVNESYQEEDYIIKENDILAIIPPVSGG